MVDIDFTFTAISVLLVVEEYNVLTFQSTSSIVQLFSSTGVLHVVFVQTQNV
jgi:hypothetical protein